MDAVIGNKKDKVCNAHKKVSESTPYLYYYRQNIKKEVAENGVEEIF